MKNTIVVCLLNHRDHKEHRARNFLYSVVSVVSVVQILLAPLQAHAAEITELNIIEQRQLLQFVRDVLRETVESNTHQVKFPESLHRLQPNSGIFVTLMKNNKVRGCYGSLYMEGADIESQIREYAIAAATLDFRHPPLHESELDDIVIILSFIGPLEPVSGVHEVDPKMEGLLIRTPAARAVLLPGEARTASWQLREARRQAGISDSEPVELYKIHTVTIVER